MSNDTQEGLEVRVSELQNAGNGLFATRNYKKGTIICEYTGTIYSNQEAWKLKDKSYLMRLGNNVYIDASNHLNVSARYINDCRCRDGYNVVFKKYPEEHKALVLALRDIEEGEEFYVNYGRLYWLAYNLIHSDHPIHMK